jgi:hypothetical protein
MPTNEILAPSYALIHYHVIDNISHVFRLYFDEVPDLDGDDGWLFSYVDADHLTGYHLVDIVTEIITRSNLDTTRATAIKIDRVEMWRSASGVNTFMGLDPADYSDVPLGVAAVDPSSYRMYVFKDAVLNQFRLTFMDGGSSSPQRFDIAPIPSADDGGIGWFMTKSAVAFVTNDNAPLVSLASYNVGYNRKLSRSYGRRLTP